MYVCMYKLVSFPGSVLVKRAWDQGYMEYISGDLLRIGVQKLLHHTGCEAAHHLTPVQECMVVGREGGESLGEAFHWRDLQTS